jgi:hypothetical protein
MKQTLLALLMVTTLLGCNTSSYEEALSRAGITGEHPLKHPNEVSALSGSLHGDFFVGTGTINGKIENVQKIMFSWCPAPNVVVSSEFPKTIFLIQTDNAKKAPTLEFIFDKDWLARKALITKKADWQTPNVNAIINSTGELQAIRIRISEADLRKEPALPQL